MSANDLLYVGVDLTDLTRPNPRPVDIAVLDGSLRCRFSLWHPDGKVDGIVPAEVEGAPFIMAIDGPLGLAGNPGNSMRVADRQMATPGKCPYDFPDPWMPFAGYLKGSVLLFRELIKRPSLFRLYGLDGVTCEDATVIEVFPGAIWPSLSNEKLAKKQTAIGRGQRCGILNQCGISLPSQDLPTHDQLDAAIAAWAAFKFSKSEFMECGLEPWLDTAKDILREGYIITPD